MRQVPLALRPEPQATFESFLADADAAALAHLRAATPPRAPVYLWGGAGSGKTHLLRALAQACAAAGHAVAWFDAVQPASPTIDPGTALLLVAVRRLLSLYRASALYQGPGPGGGGAL